MGAAALTVDPSDRRFDARRPPDALRYYERLGVIAPVKRTRGGFRVYTAEVIERLQFIKQAQRHGLTLSEIGELLRLDARRGPSQCQQMQRLLDESSERSTLG